MRQYRLLYSTSAEGLPFFIDTLQQSAIFDHFDVISPVLVPDDVLVAPGMFPSGLAEFDTESATSLTSWVASLASSSV